MNGTGPTRHHSVRLRVGAAFGLAGASIVGALAAPAIVAPHQLTGLFTSLIPLALLMVGLTAVTLWSLGQAVVTEAPESSAGPAAIALRVP